MRTGKQLKENEVGSKNPLALTGPGVSAQGIGLACKVEGETQPGYDSIIQQDSPGCNTSPVESLLEQSRVMMARATQAGNDDLYGKHWAIYLSLHCLWTHRPYPGGD